MKDVNNQTLPSITLTSGKITKLQPNLQIINIRGSVSVLQDVHVTKISSHGYSSFHGNVNSQLLNITGHCTIQGSFTIDEITNRGHLHMWQGYVKKIKSSGSVVFTSTIEAGNFEANGVVRSPELVSDFFQLILSGESQIKRLVASQIQVHLKGSLFSLSKKRLVCDNITGSNIQLVNTTAEVVEADHVTIGDNCLIGTLYYRDSFSISPKSNVTHVIRREVE